MDWQHKKVYYDPSPKFFVYSDGVTRYIVRSKRDMPSLSPDCELVAYVQYTAVPKHGITESDQHAMIAKHCNRRLGISELDEIVSNAWAWLDIP